MFKNNEIMGKADEAFQYIQKQILERRIQPGQRIVERAISQECGMSKTPVREALQRLKNMGLVAGDFQNGVYVNNLTGKDALEIFDLREVLEGLSARLAAQHANAERLCEIHDILDESRQAMAAGDGTRYSDMDQEFHFSMMRLAENERLFEIYYRLRVQASILMRSSMRLPDRGMEKSFSEHMEILKAMEEGDEVKCENAARQHMINTRHAVKKWLEQNLFL